QIGGGAQPDRGAVVQSGGQHAVLMGPACACDQDRVRRRIRGREPAEQQRSVTVQRRRRRVLQRCRQGAGASFEQLNRQSRRRPAIDPYSGTNGWASIGAGRLVRARPWVGREPVDERAENPDGKESKKQGSSTPRCLPSPDGGKRGAGQVALPCHVLREREYGTCVAGGSGGRE